MPYCPPPASPRTPETESVPPTSAVEACESTRTAAEVLTIPVCESPIRMDSMATTDSDGELAVGDLWTANEIILLYHSIAQHVSPQSLVDSIPGRTGDEAYQFWKVVVDRVCLRVLTELAARITSNTPVAPHVSSFASAPSKDQDPFDLDDLREPLLKWSGDQSPHGYPSSEQPSHE